MRRDYEPDAARLPGCGETTSRMRRDYPDAARLRAGCGETTSNHSFQAANRFLRDELRLQGQEAFAHLRHALDRTINGEVRPRGMDVDVEAVASHADSNNKSVHLIPSLRKRASQ